ncbi:MAG: hypothetical protein ACPHM2_03405, partial [Alcanivorax sp.]
AAGVTSVLMSLDDSTLNVLLREEETLEVMVIDALQTVAKGVNSLRSPERGIVLVTHYQRLLDYIVPDFVHVLSNGQIIKSGGKELALELEKKGYGWLTGEEESA